jgi:hypothetical protein
MGNLLQEFRRSGLALAGLALIASPAVAQGPPSPADVLGYDLGERFTDVSGVNRYVRALADESDLVSVEVYGESVEGQPLVQVVVASGPHRARLEEILEENTELTDPQTPASRAAEIAARNPAVTYFSYGIHGSESSSSEAAMWTAWDLARGAAEVSGVLDSVVVVLDPVVNPDGRERYVTWFRGARGTTPNSNREAREHREPWPGGRFNHYLFDLNRDWAWWTQPETRARLERWTRWNPQVHVDFHEMSYSSSYFFFPAARPVNPIYPEHTLEWGRRFGEANARAFDREGWLYFTGENYDLFYPGYGDSWPSLLGAIGMTYEQAGGGVAGLAVERPDGSMLTLRDRAMHHRTSGAATLRTVHGGKTELLQGYAEFHRSVASGLSDVLLVPEEDRGASQALIRLLKDQGIRVERATRSFRSDARPHPGFGPRTEFPAGTFRVPADQPRGRLAFALLRPENRHDAEWAYDITSWALPYAFGVEAHLAERIPEAGWAEVGGGEVGGPGEGTGPSGSEPYGYLLEPGFATAPALVDFLQMEGRAYVLADTFTLEGERYHRGTVFVPRGRNQDLDRKIRDSGLALHAVPVSTGLTEGGADLGTGDARPLEMPKVALLGGEGTSPTSFGAHWFFLERRLGMPFDAVNAEDVSALDLEGYDVIAVPSATGELTRRLGEGGMEALDGWVRGGGTLVAVGRGAQRLAGPIAGVEERSALEEDEEPERGRRLARALRTREEREQERWRDRIPGTILTVSLDPRHPLAFGTGVAGGSRLFVLSSGVGFEPDEDFESVAHFPQGLERISGVISEESLRRLRRSTWLLQKQVGRGKVILFADDPLFRMFWHSGFQPYANAILVAPAF